VINKLFNKTTQKVSSTVRSGLMGMAFWNKAAWGDHPVRFPLISIPDYIYRILSVHEVTILLNLP